MAALALVALAALTGCQTGEPVGRRPVERLLVVSMPGVTWDDVRGGGLPTLRGLVEEAAIGGLSTRIGRRGASTTDAYLSIGAGTRAVEPRVDVAVALDPDESYAGVRTEDILRRRLGRVPTGVAYLAAGAAVDVNERSAFGAEPGLLGQRLAAAGIGRAVIANADAAEGFASDEEPPDGAFARGAATALMAPDGIVPHGTVGRALLDDDPLAPFGRRLDHEAVLAAFDEAWESGGRSVVLVETSDLSRAAGYELRATPVQARELRSAALASSDELLRALLDRVDPSIDGVLVLSPVAPRAAPELAAALLRAPGIDGGLLRSPTTRRDGYVQLADVAPTVLSLFGEPQPDQIEGRAFEVRSARQAGRVERLAREAAAAERRDDLMPVVVPLVIGGLAVLLALGIIARRRTPTPRRWVPRIRVAAFAALGVVPATFATAQIDAVRSTGAYLATVAALAAAIGVVVAIIDRRRPGWGPVVAVGMVVALFSIDVVLGAPLQVNAVFGYSVAVAGRFAGLGNLAFALFGSAAVVLAALLVDRSGRAAVPWAAALLAGVVLLEGLPMLGADVGGVVSMVPAFGVTVILLSGRGVRLLDLAKLVAASGAAVILFAFVDTARPEGSRTHLARLADHLLAGRWDSFIGSLSRRLQASFGDAELGVWALVVTLLVVTAAYVVLVTRGAVDPRRLLGPDQPPVVAAVVGLVVLAGVGLVANDSSIAVPATMLIVVVPVVVLRLMPDPAPEAA